MPDGGFSKEQLAWLQAFGDIQKQAAKAETTIAKRQEGLKKGADLIENDGEAIRAGLTFEVTKLPKGLKGNFKKLFNIKDTMISLDPDKGPLQEIDTWHDLPETEPMEPGQIKKIEETFKKIIDVQDEMKALMDGDGFPIYRPLTEDEAEKKFGFEAQLKTLRDKLKADNAPESEWETAIADFENTRKATIDQYNGQANRRLSEDLWEPLKREGLVPENLIPDAYSEAARIGEGAMQAYDQRLREYTADRDKMQRLLDDLGPGFTIAENLLEATANAAGGLAGFDDVGDTAKQVKEMATMLKVVTTSIHTGAGKLINERDALSAAEAVVPTLTSIVSSAAGKEMGTMVGSITTSSIKMAKVGKHLSKENPNSEDIKASFFELGLSISSGLSATGDPTLIEIAGHLKTGFTGGKSVSNIATAVATGDSKKVIAAFQTEIEVQFKAVKPIIETAITENIQKTIEDKVSDPEEKKKLLAVLSKDGAKMAGDKDVLAGLGDLARVIDDAVSRPIREAAVKQATKAAEVERQRMQDLAERAANDFDALLPVDQEALERALQIKDGQVNNIDRLIATVRRDQMIFDLAKKIVTGGTAMVAAFVPAVGVAAVASQLMFSITEAVQRARHVDKWRRNLRDSEAAQSILADAAYNEFYYQVSHMTEINIRIGLQAVQLIGKAVETAALASGMGAPAAAAGTAVAGGAAAAQGLLTVAVTVKTTAEMAKAWSLYKKAIATPKDRKAVRMAIRANPTLAKYAMAYGAVTDKNPVAVICVKRCGLNEKTLANPGTNVSKVVTYLETIYREDPTLVRAVAEPQKWHPGAVELTAVSYNKFCVAAFSKAKPLVRRNEDNSIINSCLMGLEELPDEARACLQDSFEVDDKTDLQALKSARDCVKAVIVAIGKYAPKDPDGNEHSEMKAYLDALEAQAILAMRNADRAIEAAEAGA
ncbi:hypothetical protein I5535_13560 [Rhodobacteraceae bacterium F11138]|nr:hypothetical protein [Rhodobacteraceae bacterium F11138]